MSKERATPVDRRLVAMQERIEELERGIDAAIESNNDQQRQIEELERTCQDHGEIQASLCKQLDALQADNARLREALEDSYMCNPCDTGSQQKAFDKAQSALADTPEQSLARIRNQVLDEAINVAWNHEPDCNGPIEMALRKLKEPE